MRRVSELKSAFEGESLPIMEGVIDELSALDFTMGLVSDDNITVLSTSMAVESVVLGLISRQLNIPCHKPTDDIPYWWIQLEMTCGATLTLKANDKSNTDG